MPPTCLFPFFLFFCRFSFPFYRCPFSPSFSFSRFRSFLVLSPPSLSFRFPTLLGGGLCYFVSVLHPPRAACEPANLRISPVWCIHSFLLFTVPGIHFIFLLFSFFSISIWTLLVSFCLFLVLYDLPSVSVSVATRFAYDVYLICTYADLTLLFLSEVHDLFQLRIVYYLEFLYLTLTSTPELSCWSLPCDHGLRCSEVLMWQQQQQHLLYLYKVPICGSHVVRSITWWPSKLIHD